MERIKDALGMASPELQFDPNKPVQLTAERAGLRVSKARKQRNDLQYPIAYKSTYIHHIDQSSLARKRVLHEGTSENVIKAYKLLRTQVLKKMSANGWNTLGVMGARGKQGTSLTAVNLAISIALEHRHTVMLVDLNLHNPTIHNYFDYEPVVGLSDFLLHGTQISDMLFNPGVESLVVLPGRESLDNSSEYLTSPQMQHLVNDIKSRYASRVIIFDLPPLLESDDTVAFIEQFDAGLLVVEDGVTTKADLLNMAALLDDKPILGTVFNNASR